jgi:hypothetical protein
MTDPRYRNLNNQIEALFDALSDIDDALLVLRAEEETLGETNLSSPLYHAMDKANDVMFRARSEWRRKALDAGLYGGLQNF